MPEFWIPHPACQDGPVPLWRWLLWHVSEKLGDWSRVLEFYALHGRGYDEDRDLPF